MWPCVSATRDNSTTNSKGGRASAVVPLAAPSHPSAQSCILGFSPKVHCRNVVWRSYAVSIENDASVSGDPDIHSWSVGRRERQGERSAKGGGRRPKERG